MGQLLKKRTGTASAYAPGQRFRWVEFIEANAEEGEPAARVRIRTSLTGAELEAFTAFEGSVSLDDINAVIAPYIVDWNVVFIDADGTSYDVAPPAEAGLDAFNYIPYSLNWQIFHALRSAPFQRLDPKASSSPDSTDEP